VVLKVLPKHVSFAQGTNFELLFHMMDANESGVVSVQNICSVLGIIAKGSHEDKLRFLFSMYDSEGRGMLSHAEVEQLLAFIAERMVHWGGADAKSALSDVI